MKGVFLKKGKYKNIPGSVIVTEKDVKDEKVFDINDDNAKYFVEAGVFRAGAKPEPENKTGDNDDQDLSKLKVDELKALAAEKEIDLGEAKTKAEIIEVIQTAIVED